MRTLRGHHLLCVHGFQGMGYSPEFVETMADIVDDIRNDELDFPIHVVNGLDDACGSCPNKGHGFCNASPDSDTHVKSLDQRAIFQLGLAPNHTYQKSDLLQRTVDRVHPDDLDKICAGCSWLSYGVCKTGIQALKEKHAKSK